MKRYAMDYAEFTPEMKKTHTILAPDIFPIHMKLLQKVFHQYGFNMEVMRRAGKPVLDTGLKYIHNDMCYPAICTCGQLLDAVQSGDYDPRRVALIHFQTGGGCRASNYIKLLRKALKNMGMDYIPVISINFMGMEKHSGFNITVPMVYKAFISLLYGDLLMLLYNQVRPYEAVTGTCDAVLEKWVRDLTDGFVKNQGLIGKAVQRNMDAIAADFHNVERVEKKLIKAGIVGEIYVKYAPFGNNGLEAFLRSQDVEYMVPGVLGFFQYSLYSPVMDNRLYGDSPQKAMVSKIAMRAMKHMEGMLLKAVAPYPEFTAPSRFEEFLKLAEKVTDLGVKMGEGWCLPAEMAELIEKGYENIVCTQPFGCLPNHIVGKGVVRHVKEVYPQANICQVDYDPGASRVNQENRIKLMLAVARENMEAKAASSERETVTA
ncbi:MAG: 2-hydroxyacyl-CoA dehydratase [Oscillospiraceae bacterium]|nr:2-hydroxyacyl-CoA dehydratase [Oscillospiraceae bacterium]